MTNSLHEKSRELTGSQEIEREFRLLLESNMNGFLGPEIWPQLSRLAKRALPPSNNMGGTPPPTPLNFSHSEKSGSFVGTEETSSYVATFQKSAIDWLGFSSPIDIEGILVGLQILWPDMVFSSSKAGMRGYPKCKAMFVGEVQYGIVGFGAKHGRNSVSLTGTACKTIKTNEQHEILRELMDVLQARLSRVDLCFDFYKGEVTFDDATLAYEAGQFKALNAPKNPETKVIGSTGPDGENLGRTRYIGPRNGEKYGRVYEKGLEVFAKMPEEYRQACTEREISLKGDSSSSSSIADDWLRLEVEFKRVEKDRPIPLDILLDRDSYFAGAYPFYAWAIGRGDGKGRSQLKSDAEIDHDKLIMAHRASYGNHVHTLRQIGFTDKEIVDLLDTGLHNQKLLKSGIVAAEQAAVKAYRKDYPDSDIPF